jgi:spermidine synthase
MISLQKQAYLFAFVSGAALMTIEVAATRLLIPYFGASLLVWTGTISVILAALSFGYAWASRLAKQPDIPTVLARAAAAASLLTAFIPYAIHFIGAVLPTWRDLGSTSSYGLLIVSFFIALACLLPAGVAYGLISPLLVELLGRSGHHPGEVAGKLFSISTVGSIIGTMGTGVLFLPVLGTHMTYASAAVAMMLIAAALAKKERLVFIVCAVVLASITFAWRPSAWNTAETILLDESPYQTIRILEDDGTLQLVFNEGLGVQSVFRPETPWTGSYWDWYASIPYWRDTDDQRGLIIGYAGGTIARLWSETEVKARFEKVEGVEIDKQVLAAVREHFDANDFGAEVFVDDGRRYLANAAARYDIIAVDAYSNEFQIPFHLTTKEFFTLADRKLTEEGLLVLNVALGIESSPLFLRLANTIAETFPHTYQLSSDDSLNVLLVASRTPLSETVVTDALEMVLPQTQKSLSLKPIPFDPSIAVFTDDRAPIELLSELSMLYFL